MKTILTLAALALTLGHATANYADSPNVRVDTRGRNLVSLSIVPADQPAPAALPDGEVMAVQATSSNTVPSGGVKQFLAWAQYDDNTTEDVTAQASWSLGSGLPRLTSLFGGFLKVGETGVAAEGTVTASFSAGNRAAVGSCSVSVLPGPQIELEAASLANGSYVISLTAKVLGAQVVGAISRDLDNDEVFGESGEVGIRDESDPRVVSSALETSGAGFRNLLVRVQAVADGQTVARSFIVEVGRLPLLGQPQTLPVQDITVEGLKIWNGDSLVNGGLQTGKSGLAVVIHGLNNSAATPWVGDLCEAIQDKVSTANVVAWDWWLMADPSLYVNGLYITDDVQMLADKAGNSGAMLTDLAGIRLNGKTNGMLLAERLLAEFDAGRLPKDTPIHLIGHSAGGFVAGECASRLSKAGFSELLVTMLDTPIPFRSHVGRDWRTERYISSILGGRFELEPSMSTALAKAYNGIASWQRDKIETIVYTESAQQAYMGYSQSTAAVLTTNYDAKPVVGLYEGSNYRRVEIEHPDIFSKGVIDRHSFAHEWYMDSVNATMPGGEGGFLRYSNLLGYPPPPFPQSMEAMAAPMAMAESMEAMAEQPPPVDLDGFTYFGTASGVGGVHTFTENTDAGMWKNFTLPIGSQTLRFRYQFTTPGDGDFLAAYWGEEAVLVICPDTASARAGFVEMEADVSRFGGQQGNLVFKLVSRGEVNAVAQIDQVQIVLSDDPDDDGLTNDQEAAYGTNAHLDDSDGDGLSDYDEVTTHGTDPTKADSDGDMVQDAAELAASTNPLDKNSFLRPRMERGASGQPELLWQGVTGRSYSVVRSLDLTGTAFDFIRTEVPGAGVDCSVTDPDTTVNPRAFYWVLPE